MTHLPGASRPSTSASRPVKPSGGRCLAGLLAGKVGAWQARGAVWTYALTNIDPFRSSNSGPERAGTTLANWSADLRSAGVPGVVRKRTTPFTRRDCCRFG